MIGAEQLRKRHTDGETLFGTFISEMTSPATIQILKNSGFAWCIVDTEHGIFDPDMVYRLIDAGRKSGLCVMVRIPLTDTAMIQRALDAGADAILIPMIRTMDDVRRSVTAAKFAPLGRRGLHFLRPHADFIIPADIAAQCKKTNQTTILAVQIETLASVELIDQIAATDGVDMVFLGPGDLSAEMGHCQGLTHPDVQAVAGKIGQACEKHGKIAAGHVDYAEHAPILVDEDIRVISCSVAAQLLCEGGRAFIDRAQKPMK